MRDNRLDIVFRFRPSAESPDGLLLHYLKNLGVTPISNEMVLKALRAFWLPDTYFDCGEKRGGELKKLAQHTIFSLEEHANYLRNRFGIERQPPSIVTTYLNPGTLQEQEPEDDQDDDSNDVWNLGQRLDTGGL